MLNAWHRFTRCRAKTVRRSTRPRGFTLIELLVTLTVFGLLAALAYPELMQWLQSTRTRSNASSLLAGVQRARSQAIQRNATVYFQLTDTLDDGCTTTPTGNFWVVSQFPLNGRCAEATDSGTDYLAPGIDANSRALILAKAERGLDANLTVTASHDTLCFNATGRLIALGADCVQAPAAIQLRPTNAPGACSEAGRCYNVTVSVGGEARLCDPSRTALNDPRRCYT